MDIDHVAIWTPNIERLGVFYETYFQATSGEIYTNPKKNYQSRFLSFASGARLELMQMPDIPLSLNNPEKQFTGFIHIAISVGSPDQVDNLTAKLRQDGYPIVSEPRRTGDGYYESCVLDPDQNRIEITA